MEKQRNGAARAAIEHALAHGEWPWPEALRLDAAFVDGIVELSVVCQKSEVNELALAASVADEHPGRSALGRLLLIARRASSRDAVRSGTTPGAGAGQRSGSAPGAVWLCELRGIQWDHVMLREMQSRPLEAGACSAGPLGPQFDPADVWSWPLPEEPVRLVAPPMAFSASRLNGYVKCPRRWFYEYLCDAVEDEGSLAATYGHVFHEALEALHRVVRVPSEWSGNAILERLHGELDLAFERSREEFASRLEFEVSRLKARAVAAHYARWLRAEADDHPTRVDEVESLQRWSMAGHEFVGFIDRIDRPLDGGPITIYDYKTGRIDEDVEEYLERVRSGEEAQLALYYASRRLRGDRVGRLALVSLRDPRDPVWVLALDVADEDGVPELERVPRAGVVRGTCRPSDMDASIAALVARADVLTQTGIEHFAPGADPPCMHCAYARACREQPVEAERVFAR